MKKFNFKRMLFVTMLALLANVMMAQTYTYPVKGQKGFSLSQKTRDGIHINYELGQFNLSQVNFRGEEMSEIEISGIVLPNTAGSPNLPTESRMLAIPTGAKATLNVVNYDMEIIKNVNIAPALRVQAEAEEPEMEYNKDMAVYTKDAFYPENPFIVASSYIRGVDAVTVSITPFQYNPVTKELAVYSNVELALSYEGGKGEFGEDRLRSPYWDPILAAELMNYDQLPVIDYEARMQEWVKGNREGYEYLIITPNNDDWAPYAQQLKEFRTKQGILTEVFRLDQIPATTTTQLKTWFHNAYATWDIPPVAVLLLGDHNTNMAQGIPAETTSHPYNGSCITDNFYADAAGSDNLPDMVFSRLVAQNASELPIFVGKQIDYETSPNMSPAFYQSPVTALGWQTERWFQICSEVFGGYMRNHGYTPIRINCPYNNSTPGSSWSSNQNTSMVTSYFGPTGLGYIPANPQELGGFTGGTPDQVVTAVNNGIFWLQHRDHGYNEGWGEPSVNNGHIDQMNNVGMLPFVMSINCQTGMFNYTGSGGNCFAEKWMRRTYNGQNAGAVGVLCPTEVSYSFVNDAFVWGVYDLFDGDFMPDYGPYQPAAPKTGNWMPAFGNVAGKYFLAQSSWPSNPDSKDITYTMFTAHCDAFLRIFTHVPEAMTVQHQNVQLAGLSTFQITAPEGTTIALTKGEGENLEIVAVATATGSVQNLEIPAQVPPTVLHLTVTGQNYLRYENDIDVIPSSGPYIIVNAYELSNSATQLNFGEDAGFDIQLKNVGSSQAPAGTMTLSTESEYVTITNGTVSFAAINANNTLDLDEAFSMTVADNVPNNTPIVFNVTITSGDDTYESSITLKAYAPVLEIGTMAIREIHGNNNGRLDPGETVQLKFGVINKGNASTRNAAAILSLNNPYMELLSSPITGTESIAAEETFFANYEVYICGSPSGATAEFSLAAESGAYAATKDFSAQLNLNVEDFEAGSLDPMWTNTSPMPWTITTEEAFSGSHSLQSGAISHSSSTELILNYNVQADDQFVFYYKVSSENNYDKLYFYIDNNEQNVWSGNVEWTRAEYNVTEGNHTFKWKYQKDGSVSNGSDCAWIDYVVFPRDYSLTVVAGHDVSICADESAQLNGYASNNTSSTWSTLGDGTFSDVTILNPVYTPGTQDIANGGTSLILTASKDSETLTDTISMTIIGEPIPIGDDRIVAYSTDPVDIAFEFENLGYFIGWITSGTGYFTNPYSPSTTYVPTDEDFDNIDITLTAQFTGCGYKTYIVNVELHFSHADVTNPQASILRIHPNPTSNIINISLENVSSNVQIKVYNSLGQVVYTQSETAIDGLNTVLNIGDLSNGMYILQVRSDDDVWTRKIIKK